MSKITTIQGGLAKDHRGQIRFVNDFDMSLVRRFYIIKNGDTEFIRGWRAHKIEKRWFYVLSGAFKIYLVKIDDWESPSGDLEVYSENLDCSSMRVLFVPEGYGTALQALNADSELLVFADYPISNATLDDYTWPLEYFRKM